VILSFFPAVTADINLSLPKRFIFSAEEIALIKRAEAIILPPLCRGFYYWFCKKNAPVFPNVDTRFYFPGKAGHIFVFNLAGISYPPTKVFRGLEDFKQRHSQGEPIYPYPLVVKWHWGGGGAFVHLVKSENELEEVLTYFKRFKKRGTTFVVQPYIEHGHCDLRVVIIGSQFFTYWRCQESPDEFRNNVSRGAKIYYNLHPKLEKMAVGLTKQIYQKTGLNLAAFDIIFSTLDETPLFLEINYGFGLLGIGGYERYKGILNEEVQKWICGLTSLGGEREEMALR
jgi:ribosomal protein S6--L-glutamate ligase